LNLRFQKVLKGLCRPEKAIRVGTDTYNYPDANLTGIKSEIDLPSSCLLTSATREANKKCDVTLYEKRLVEILTETQEKDDEMRIGIIKNQ
jgi:hypothetical protein